MRPTTVSSLALMSIEHHADSMEHFEHLFELPLLASPPSDHT